MQEMSTYIVTDSQGIMRGEQTMTDTMAERMEAKGYHLVPVEQVHETVRFAVVADERNKANEERRQRLLKKMRERQD